LDGLSTSWVLEEYRRADDVYHEHLQIIDAFSAQLKASEDHVRVLERENAELRAKYQALHRKQFKPNKMHEKDEGEREKIGSSSAGKKKRGAPVGHPAWTRPIPTRIDRVIHVPAPAACPHCGSNALRPEETLREHIQEDIIIKPRVTKYA
jgi:NAD-dependent SIR2 family protein deacetylase